MQAGGEDLGGFVGEKQNQNVLYEYIFCSIKKQMKSVILKKK